MAGKGRGGAVVRNAKSSGRQAAGRKKADPYEPVMTEEDPYRDLRIPEDERRNPEDDDYIWPEYEDEDEDRV